jgi:Family of unknown function (DUF6474)
MALRKKAADDEKPPRITPSKAKNAVAVTKIISAAVLPAVTPYLTKTTGTVRDGWDRMRARRLGVGIDELAKYTGRGGSLHARLAGAAGALTDLRDKPGSSAGDLSWADSTETKLRQLTAAVRAAERMPGPRRRAAHKAVAAELDQIEESLLHRLGV